VQQRRTRARSDPGNTGRQAHNNTPALEPQTHLQNAPTRTSRPSPQPSPRATHALSPTRWASSAIWSRPTRRVSPPLQGWFRRCCVQSRAPRLAAPRTRLACFTTCAI
jgi:hypothetical protein